MLVPPSEDSRQFNCAMFSLKLISIISMISDSTKLYVVLLFPQCVYMFLKVRFDFCLTIGGNYRFSAEHMQMFLFRMLGYQI